MITTSQRIEIDKHLAAIVEILNTSESLNTDLDFCCLGWEDVIQYCKAHYSLVKVCDCQFSNGKRGGCKLLNKNKSRPVFWYKANPPIQNPNTGKSYLSIDDWRVDNA